METNTIYGYIRVSTKEQNLDRQRNALAAYGILPRNLYADQQSGKDFDRPAYKRLLRRMKKGDLLIMKSIDRLGRSYSEVMEQWRVITKEKCVDIKVADMPLLDTTYGKDLLGTFIADLTLQVMSFTAQLERETTLQRQMEGIAAAKARGVVFGGQKRPMPENFGEMILRWENGEFTTDQFAEKCGVCRRTLFQRLGEFSKAKTE